MDLLKSMKAKLKQEKQELVGTEKKYFTKAELEAARLLKIRAEEEEERKKKELKRKKEEGDTDGVVTKQARQEPEKAEQLLPNLSREEVIRRLRALGQPATLFGEEDVDRLKRFLRAEKEVKVEDEQRGGQQENLILELQKAERERAKARHKEIAAVKAAAAAETAGRSTGASTGSAAAVAGGSSGSQQPGGEATGGGGGGGAANGSKADGAAKKEGNRPASGPAAPESGEVALTEDQIKEQQTMEAFKRAAALLQEKREEESMAVEERCLKWVKRWMKEWEEDLDRRPDSIKATASGYQATITFQQTQKYLEPLYDRLKHKALHDELRAGLWMMVQAMRERNYLYANDFYLRLAIGNAPWPIGVTSVGIHERSAREKISHVMNASGQAHIMNDEATRKWLQAMKRLISAVQRMYPTDPSRSVDFETTADLGRGMAGAGSTKLALLQAEAKGESTATLGLPSAPHFLEKDGKVMIPPKWDHILKQIKQKEPGLADGSSNGGGSRGNSPGPGE